MGKVCFKKLAQGIRNQHRSQSFCWEGGHRCARGGKREREREREREDRRSGWWVGEVGAPKVFRSGFSVAKMGLLAAGCWWLAAPHRSMQMLKRPRFCQNSRLGRAYEERGWFLYCNVLHRNPAFPRKSYLFLEITTFSPPKKGPNR